MEYKPVWLDADILKKRLSELGRLGLKSIMYAGEGEPFLHARMAEIINHTKKAGIDVAVTSNGVLFNEEAAEKTISSMAWIKISINGATRNTYAMIHRCKPGDFDKVIKNMSFAVKLKKKRKYKCALGMQLLLLPENFHEAVSLARLARDIGIDYLAIKPYSQHPQSKTRKYSAVNYRNYEYLRDKLMKMNTRHFNVIFRLNAMKKWDSGERNYRHCLALPFWSYIDAAGNVWGCSVYIGKKSFFYGNIYKQSFKDIWTSARRLKSLRWSENKLDAFNCRINCRMDEINRYLWDLKNSPEHVNFI